MAEKRKKDLIIKMRKDGWGYIDIEEVLEVSSGYIYRVLREAGLIKEPRKRRPVKRGTKKR